MTDGDTRADLTDEPAATTSTDPPADTAPASPLRWWKEMLIAGGFFYQRLAAVPGLTIRLDADTLGGER